MGRRARSVLPCVLVVTLAACGSANAPHSTASQTVSSTQSSRSPGATAGNLDPCAIALTGLPGGVTVTHQSVSSDRPPSSECVYTFAGSQDGQPGTGQLAVYTLTAAQAATGVPATTPAAEFASIPRASSAGGSQGYSSNGAGDFKVEGTTSGEPDYALLFAPANASSAVLLRVEDQHSTYRVSLEYCYSEIANMFIELFKEAGGSTHLGPAAEQAALDQVRNDITDWCRQEAVGR